MSPLLAALFGRLPIGWLQLVHNRPRFAAALAGVALLAGALTAGAALAWVTSLATSAAVRSICTPCGSQ